MEIISARELAKRLIFFALLFCTLAACGKKKEATATDSSTPSQGSPTSISHIPTAPPITGPITPALVNQDANSLTRYLHFPKDLAAAKLDSAVQFYCDISANGSVETTHALIGKNDAFKTAVQTALDWGRFTPATAGQKPIAVYLAGTVLFLHQDGKPVIVVSLATYDRERVGRLVNYLQPQLVGGLRQALDRAISSLTKGVLVGGRAEAVVQVNNRGAITATSAISENPQGSGLGDLLNGALKGAQFTPAYEDGKPAAGAINVVADFGEL